MAPRLCCRLNRRALSVAFLDKLDAHTGARKSTFLSGYGNVNSRLDGTFRVLKCETLAETNKPRWSFYSTFLPAHKTWTSVLAMCKGNLATEAEH